MYSIMPISICLNHAIANHVALLFKDATAISPLKPIFLRKGTVISFREETILFLSVTMSFESVPGTHRQRGPKALAALV